MNPLALPDNPFRTTVVTDPWQPLPGDVREIHAAAFDACRRALVHVQAAGRSTSLLVFGEAGSGKTHLLARLRAHLFENAASPPCPPLRREEEWRGEMDAGHAAAFVAVRLQTAARMIWRYLRSRLVDDFLRPRRDGLTQLEWLLLRRLAEFRPAEGDIHAWWEWLKAAYPAAGDLQRELDGAFDELSAATHLRRDTCVVLGHLLAGRARRDAKAWLRGESLPEEVLSRLELAAESGIGEEDKEEHLAREMILELCRLAGARSTIVLCFDQIEALQTHPQDQAGVFAFGQMVSALHAETTNVLLVCCVQSTFIPQLNHMVREADLHRIKEGGAVALQPLLWEDSRRLIEARLQANPELGRVRPPEAAPLWPLNEVQLRCATGPTGWTARKLLSVCAEQYEAARAGVVSPPEPVPDFLQRIWHERLEQSLASASVEQTDAIVGHGLPLLLTLIEDPPAQARDHGLPDVDFVLETDSGRVGVSLCNQRHMTGLAGRLRRLREQLDQRKLVKLVLLRDSRLTISAGAKRAREYLDDLTGREARLLQPRPESLAALDALRGLLSEARSGDLSHAGEAVAPATLEDWLARHLPASLQELIDDVLAYEPLSAAGTDQAAPKTPRSRSAARRL